MKNIQELTELIPHRYPILLVDQLEELQPGERAKGIKNVSANEPFLQGHFPQRPLMPGVLLIESMAQVGACALMSQEEHQGKLAVFGGVDNVKFKRQVEPGDTLKIEVELTKVKGSIGKGQGTVHVGDELAAKGELTFALVEK